ncbi:reverse transcriptase domain-containing protein [Gloeocapsopsis dulcis]|uniref:reverse transcriptase domain-containing protein n=1 Tax=Gloeocapsopsis dulcis TaxID=2859516 RepID=UPI0030B81BD4
MEPAAEAQLNAHSYGFRPGRSCHDVQQGIFNQLKANAKGTRNRILELDIEKCFDKIDHKFLMQSVQIPRAAKLGIFRAIKAGVRGEFPSSETGTPQGGVISPLLANLVLHGLENVGYELRYKVKNGGTYLDALKGFRYADDVVYILSPEDDENILRERIDQFLATRGLKVKEAKTKVIKSTDGFDFLGWNFCVKPNGKFITTPSRKFVKGIKTKVKEVMQDSRFTLEERIDKCEAVVRGWRNYHRFCDMSQHDLWSLNHWVWKFIRTPRKIQPIPNQQGFEESIPICKMGSMQVYQRHWDKIPVRRRLSVLVKKRKC